jgi:hypothetical protein
MQKHPSASIKNRIKKIALVIVELQKQMDEYYALELEHFKANIAKPYFADDLLVGQALLPIRQTVSDLQIQMNLMYSVEEEKTAEIGANVFGFPIDAFYESRYGSTKDYRDHLSVTLEAKPLVQSTQNGKEFNNG